LVFNHDKIVWGLSFSSNNNLLLSGGEDNKVKLYNIASEELSEFSDH